MNVCFYICYNLGTVAVPEDMTMPEYNENPLYFRFVVMVIAGLRTVYLLFARFAYHEASLMATGISYQAATKEQEENHNSIRNVKILTCLITSCPKELFSSWNMRTQFYLKHFVMMRNLDRSVPRGKTQPFPIAMTFLVSALIHGFYVGYYLAFLGFGLLDFNFKLAEQTALVQYLRKKLPGFIITWIAAAFL